MTLRETCDELEQALAIRTRTGEHESTRQALVRTLVSLGERKSADVKGYARREDVGGASFREALKKLERFAALKARAEEVLRG